MSGQRIYKQEDFPAKIPNVTTDKNGNTIIEFKTPKKRSLGMADPSINYEGIHEKLW